MSVGILLFHLLPLSIITDTILLPRLFRHLTGKPTRDRARKSQIDSDRFGAKKTIAPIARFTAAD